ncbi:MAG: hypothetical protein HY825_08455 [Acidobacteria bacterium]|nr:hypothetical protein [Acidobacteriota bacterium]
MSESCALCGCVVHRQGRYAEPTQRGRSHATKHHFVPQRFFGRSANRPRTVRPAIFKTSPWPVEDPTAVFCYECHEELLHNPVLLPEDLDAFRRLVALRGLDEARKPASRVKIAGRIELFHEVIAAGLEALLTEGSSAT